MSFTLSVSTATVLTPRQQEARQCLLKGDMSGALKLADQLLQANPNDPEACHVMAFTRYNEQKLDEALLWITKGLAHETRDAQHHHMHGIILQALGRTQEATEAYTHALQINPDFALPYFQLGLMAHQSGDKGRAVPLYEHALFRQPGHMDALNNLGVVLQETGRLKDSIVILRRAIERRPNLPVLHNNLGYTYYLAGQIDEAIKHYQKAFELDPGYADAHYNLGLLYQRQLRYQDAINHYKAAVKINPKHHRAIHNMGLSFFDGGNAQRAVELYRQALELEPDYPEAYSNLGMALSHQSKVEPAREALHTAARYKGDNPLWTLRAEAVCPIIPSHTSELEDYRTRMLMHIERLTENPPSIELEDLMLSDCRPSFYLPYHGLNDRRFKEAFAQMVEAMLKRSGYPILLQSPKVPVRDKIHLGFVLTNGHEKAFIKLLKGIVDRLPRDTFDISVFDSLSGCRFLTKQLGHPESISFHALPDTLKGSIHTIKNQALDIAFHMEVGTDAKNYLLPLFRLAKTQVTSWGFPDTTGMSAVDYYLSSTLWEGDNAAENYTEQLITPASLPVFYERPVAPGQKHTRSDFGLPESGPLFVCAQQLFKIQPDFDQTLAEILDNVANSRLILFKAPHPHHDELLQARLSQSIARADERILWMSKFSEPDYLDLLAVRDLVFLDTPRYDGGITAFDAVAQGAAVVCQPGAFLRGRKMTGCYRQIGVETLIADGPESYITMATRLATDEAFRREVQDNILTNADKLFHNEQAVSDFVNFCTSLKAAN